MSIVTPFIVVIISINIIMVSLLSFFFKSQEELAKAKQAKSEACDLAAPSYIWGRKN